MDTTTKIMMKILDDLYSTPGNELTSEYAKYYESTAKGQPRIVVGDVLDKIAKDMGGKVVCEKREDDFTIKIG